MPERNAKGTFSPIIYFESPTGLISLPGTDEEGARGQNGWLRKEANTLQAVDALQKKMEEQDRRELRGQLDRDEAVFEMKRQKTRDSLLKSLTRNSTTHYEKEFIREYLSTSDERKKRFYQKDKQLNAYFMAREFDDGGKQLMQE